MIDRENTKAGLLEVLEQPLGAGRRERELVASLLDLYDEEGLFSPTGEARPLFSACDRCGECWAPEERVRRLPPNKATVAAPWIGPRYPTSRVCALGINGNRWGGLSSTWWMTRSDIEHRRGHLNLGTVKTSTNAFYAKVARFLRPLLDPETEFSPSASVDRAGTADVWEQVAYLQSVKCSPDQGDRGSPTDTMVANCPPRYLAKELERIDPSVLLVIGKGTWWSVAEALGGKPPDGDRYADRRSIGLKGGRELDVFYVVHPGNPEFLPRSLEELADLL